MQTIPLQRTQLIKTFKSTYILGKGEKMTLQSNSGKTKLHKMKLKKKKASKLAIVDRCEISPSFDLVNSAIVLLTFGPQWAIVLGERPPGWAYFLGGSVGTNTTEARRQHVCNDKIMETS